MKVLELVAAQPVMQDVLERKMPSKLAYALAKNFRLISQEIEDYNKTRLKLLAENWPLDEKTNRYNIPDEDQAKWKKMHDELINSESTYVPYKIDISLTDGIEWSPGELLNLWFIFEGEGAGDLAPKML